MSDKAVRTAEMQRVIEQTIHAGVSPQRTDDGLRIVCKTRSFDDYELELHLTAKAVESAKIADPDFELPKAPISLARYIASTSTLTTFPINTNFGKYFLNPKYSRLTTIILTEVSPLGSFNDGEHIYFEDLPVGLIREPLAGFGLNYDLRFIAKAVQRQDGITTLRLSNESGVSREGDALSMSYSLFGKFRRDINRTHKRALDIANKAKEDYLESNLNIMLDPTFKLPQGDGTRRPVADILAETLIGKARSPEAEAKAAARTVKKSVNPDRERTDRIARFAPRDRTSLA